jgi:hypothetical protein
MLYTILFCLLVNDKQKKMKKQKGEHKSKKMRLDDGVSSLTAESKECLPDDDGLFIFSQILYLK